MLYNEFKHNILAFGSQGQQKTGKKMKSLQQNSTEGCTVRRRTELDWG